MLLDEEKLVTSHHQRDLGKFAPIAVLQSPMHWICAPIFSPRTAIRDGSMPHTARAKVCKQARNEQSRVHNLVKTRPVALPLFIGARSCPPPTPRPATTACGFVRKRKRCPEFSSCFSHCCEGLVRRRLPRELLGTWLVSTATGFCFCGGKL